MYLTLEEKAFIRWALQYLVSENAVHINPEGRFFFRKKFFEEMDDQYSYLTDLGKACYQAILYKVTSPNNQ